MKNANRGSSRLDRVSSLIREEVARLLLFEVQARKITITTVKVTRDLSIAKVY